MEHTKAPQAIPGRSLLMFVPWCRRCQASLRSTLAAMPLNESRRDLSPKRAGGGAVRRDQVRVLARRDDRLGNAGKTKTRDDPPLQPLCLVRFTTLHEMPSTTPR